MQKHYNYLTIDLDRKIYNTLKAKQGDSKSRYILVNLISNNLPYNLTGTSVKIFGKKKDTTIFFNAATIIDAENGQFEIELTNQALAVPGYLKIEILISGANQERLTTSYFLINVEETITDDAAIESTNEFTALTNALSSVQNIDNRFAEVDEQFNTIVNTQNIVSLQKLKNVYDAKCVGGSTDDTLAIQKCIDDLEITGLVKTGGIIELPPGEIRLDGLKFKKYNYFSSYNNRVILRGAGIQATTLVCDDLSNDNFIDFQGTYENEGVNRRQVANVSFQDMKLKCTATTNKLAFNYSVTQYCDLTNVWIEDFKGGALRFEDSYDANFYNVQIIRCGRANSDSDYAPAIGLYRRSATNTNALHFTNCRLEFLPIFLHSDDLSGNKQTCVRHIYFDNCKFEKMALNTISRRPIDLRYHNEIGFNNCFFVNSNQYSDLEYVCDNGLHFMKLDYDSSSNVTSSGQIQSTKFSNCHFVCPSKTWSNWGSLKGVHIVNTDFNSCYGMSDNTECFYLLGENIFNNVNISGKGNKLFILKQYGNDININLMRVIDGTNALVKIYADSNNNNLIINIYDCVNNDGLTLIKLDDVTSFRPTTHEDKYFIKNNIIKIMNDNEVKEFTSNLPNVSNVCEIIKYNATQLNYLNYAYNNKIITIVFPQTCKIKYDYTLMNLKGKADLTVNANEYLTLKCINGVWYEI